ncbi:MAG TPA: hypothetical protein DDW27_03625 [Bacteroidales bacterium]|nr:hypothetical protein [Bacteroidales bacterium]
MKTPFCCCIHVLILINWIWGISGFLLGLAAGAFLIFLYSRYSIYSILETEKNKYLNDLKKDADNNILYGKLFKYLGIVKVLKKRKNEKQEQIIARNRTIFQLKEQNEELFEDIELLRKRLMNQRIRKENLTSPGEVNNSIEPDLIRKPENSSEVYFTIPESDGSFKIINSKYSKGIDCFYKITPDKSGRKGALHFLPGEYDMRALENIDYYLHPVCEIQNISNRATAKRIVMTDTGRVIRRNDSWQIEENRKVKVKLV